MTSKQYCLKWNNFQSNILHAFESLQTTEDLTDVTLTCEGLNIRAHRFILSACSPYFRTVFKENPCSHPIIILKDVFYADLCAVINFMYHGEVLVSEEQLPSFLQTAKLLQVSGLNNTETTKKSPKKNKPAKLEPLEYPIKKAKLMPKAKSKVIASDNAPNSPKDNTEGAYIVPEPARHEEHCADENENVDFEEKTREESSGSILEAALEKTEWPESILERSLTLASKSPSSHPFEPAVLIPESAKPIFGCRKPPDLEIFDKRAKQSTSSRSSSPAVYDRPAEFLQQTIKIEEDSIDTGEEEENSQPKMIATDVQPHHSSQCGNCPHCGKVYSNQSALKYHVRLVHSDLTNMYCCHLCPEAFNYREGYKKHMVEVHFIRN